MLRHILDFALAAQSIDPAGSANAIEHPGGGFVIGFGPACTHMGCLLVRSAEDHDVQFGEVGAERATCGPCRCHGTTFDLLKNGLVILGAATQHLPRIKLKLSGPSSEFVEPDGWLTNPDPRFESWPDGGA